MSLSPYPLIKLPLEAFQSDTNEHYDVWSPQTRSGYAVVRMSDRSLTHEI